MKSFILPEDPYMYLPSEDKDWQFVLQAHVRSRSVHGDLRLQITKDLLVGWTLDWIKGIARPARSLEDATKIIHKRLPQAFRDLLDPHVKTVCQKKAVEPAPWLHVNAWFPKGTVGATRFHPGQMIIVDHGTVEFLCQKPSFHEYWFHGSTLKNRFTVRQLPNVWHKKAIDTGETDLTGRGFAVWMASFTKDLLPYAISMRAVQHAWYPPEGFSCLPRHVRKQIPERFRYWHLKGKKAHAVRDDLVVRIHKHSISITP